MNLASMRTGLIETEEVVVYKGAWPCILRYTEPSDSGALRQTAALMLPFEHEYRCPLQEQTSCSATTDLCRTAGGRAALEVEASVLLFIQRIGVLQLQGFSWATATFRGKGSC